MENQKGRIIDEKIKSRPIPIKINKSEIFSENYYLKNETIDPSQSSPPNTFLLKLHNRISAFSKV